MVFWLLSFRVMHSWTSFGRRSLFPANVDIALYNITEMINECTALHIPNKTLIHFPKHNQPWLTNDLRRLVIQGKLKRLIPGGTRQTRSALKFDAKAEKAVTKKFV